MSLIRRIALVVSIVFGGSLALAAAVLAASGGGGGLDPGVYTFANKDASANFANFSLSVDQGLNSFRPRDPKGPRTIMNSTIVNLVLFDDSGNATFGCFMINPSDFNISKDLQTARVHTTLTADELCPGFGAPITGQSGKTPFAAGGGGGTDLPLPITLDVKWTGLGVTSSGTDRNTFKCLGYNTEFTTSFHSSDANASGTVSALGGTSFTTPSAVVSSSATHATVKGTLQPACFAQ
jgi:hypothetical protein